jgi:hypothetical protein
MSALYERPDWHRLALLAAELQGQGLSRSPTAFTALLLAYQIGSEGTELAVVGEWDRSHWLPLTTLAIGLADSLPALSKRQAGLAYLCRQGACRLPAQTLQQLIGEIQAIYPQAVVGSQSRIDR